MPDADEKLFRQLDVNHPDYTAWQGEWERYRDVIGDELVPTDKYLPRNAFELQSQYEFRVALSEFIPESGLAVERLLSALYKEKPRRDLGSNEAELTSFIENASSKGESWDKVVEDIAFQMLGYGTTRSLVNVKPANAEGFLTRNDEKALGIRPTVVNYSPLSVKDWEHDEDGELVFARIKEERTVKGQDKKGDHSMFFRFLEYTRDSVQWWDFLKESGSGKKLKMIDNQTRVHGLGIVPMVVKDLRMVKPFIGHSFIRYSSAADLCKYRAESDLAYDGYIHAHPFLAIWTEDELKEVGVGSSSFLKLNPGTSEQGREDAKYLDTPSSAFDALQKLSQSAREQIFRQTKIDPLSQMQNLSSTFQVSGVSRAWSFGTSEARVLSRIASVMEQVEAEVFELVLRFQSGSSDLGRGTKLFDGVIQYPEEFDLASTSQLIQERQEIGGFVNSPTFLRILDKRVVSSKIGDTTMKELKEINKEIDDNPLLGTMAGRQQANPFSMPNMAEEPTEDENQDQANVSQQQRNLRLNRRGIQRRTSR